MPGSRTTWISSWRRCFATLPESLPLPLSPEQHKRLRHYIRLDVFSPRCIVQCTLTIASRLDVMNRLGRALADPTRSRIILTLLDHPAYPAELARALDLTRSNVSNHLACLRDCGIVVSEPEGRRTRYEIADPHLTQALTTLVDATLAVDEGAPCIDPACSLPGCDVAREGA